MEQRRRPVRRVDGRVRRGFRRIWRRRRWRWRFRRVRRGPERRRWRGRRLVASGFRTADCTLQTGDCGLLIADCFFLSWKLEAGRLIMRKNLLHGLVVVVALGLSGCSYNKFTSQEETVKAQWSEIQNQLQRRNDLIG